MQLQKTKLFSTTDSFKNLAQQINDYASKSDSKIIGITRLTNTSVLVLFEREVNKNAN